MKTLELKSLRLINFMGIKDQTFHLDRSTNIFGDNGTGKTTFKHALKWLLFGVNADDKTEKGRGSFSLKPKDSKGNDIHGLDTIVIGEWYQDSELITLKRLYHEIWSKPRGGAEKVFTGHETKYWIDNTPKLAGEYQKKIDEIIELTLFKLITDPLYFSSVLPWNERRETLEVMAGGLTIDEIIEANPKLEPFRERLSKKSIDDLKKEIKDEKKNHNDELKQIPARIDENNNQIVDLDENSITKELEEKKAELKKVEDQLTNATEEDPSIAESKKELNEIRTKINKLENEVNIERATHAKKLATTLRNYESKLEDTVQLEKETREKLENLYAKKKDAEADIEKCRLDWDTEKAKTYKAYLEEVS